MNLAFLNDKTPLEAALYYASLGWPVFPVHTPIEGEWIEVEIDRKRERILKCSCGNLNCGKQTGKHPRVANNLEVATTNEAQIKEWWGKWPNANVGLKMGLSLAVIDVDVRSGGLKSLQELLMHSPNLQNTVTAITGSEGYHYFTKVPLAAGQFPSRVGVWGKDGGGIDIRAEGGYAIAAPSLHRNGRRYHWSDSDSEIEEIDTKLLEKFRRHLREKEIDIKAESRIKIPEGQRNDTLFRIACQKCAHQWSKEDTLAHLLRQNHERCDPPLSEAEIQKIVSNAFTYDPSYDHSDTGNTERFFALAGKDIRWVANLGWLYWEDMHWEQTDEDKIIGLAKLFAKQLKAIAIKNDDDELRKWALRTENLRPLQAIVKLIKDDVRADIEDLNTHPLWFPCANGIYEIDDRSFRKSVREDLILQRSPVVYDPSARCPLWESSLLKWMGGDKEMVAFLQRLVGYFLTGDASYRHLYIFWGSGANGKSTFTRVIDALLGPLSAAVSTDLLMRHAHISKEQEKARLYGTRLAVCSESPENAMIDNESVKSLTGNDKVRAKVVYNKPFDFSPTHKIVLHTNEKPKLTYNDTALWDRIKLILWPVRIPDGQQDPELSRKLLGELSGILNWGLRGTEEGFLRGGLFFPAKIEEATKVYRSEMDQMGLALEELCLHGSTDRLSDARVKADLLYQRYSSLMGTWGTKPKLRTMFYEYLRSRPDIRLVESGGAVYAVGLSFKEDGKEVSLAR